MDQNMNGSGVSGGTNSGMNMGSNMEHKPVGPVIGLIVILVVILAGGVYFWMSKDSTQNINNNTEQINVEETPSSEIIQEQGSSDDTSSIEADLNAFGESDINSIDSI
jgi:FlaG/FlaF family flagellin (archaellin)